MTQVATNCSVDPGLQELAEAWDRSMRAANRSPRTRKTYLEAVNLFANYQTARGRPTDPASVQRGDVVPLLALSSMRPVAVLAIALAGAVRGCRGRGTVPIERDERVSVPPGC